jgi:hypothetical protein
LHRGGLLLLLLLLLLLCACGPVGCDGRGGGEGRGRLRRGVRRKHRCAQRRVQQPLPRIRVRQLPS